MNVRIPLLILLMTAAACQKDNVTPANGSGTPDLVASQAGAKIVGRLSVAPESNNDGQLLRMNLQQAANDIIYFNAEILAPVTGGSNLHFLTFSKTDKEIKTYAPTPVSTGVVDQYYYLEGQPDDEFERVDINTSRLNKNGASWSPLDRVFYPYTSSGGYDVLSVNHFNSNLKKLVGLSPYSELGIYDFSTRTTTYYAPKPFSPPAPIGVTFRSDLLLDEKFSSEHPGHHRIIVGSWDYKSLLVGGTVKRDDLMLIITEASDTITQRVNYNSLVNATRMLTGDTIATMKSDGHAIDYSSERGFVRLCQDDSFVWAICYNTNQTLSVIQYDKKLKKLKKIIDQSATLYTQVPFDITLRFEKLSGTNQILAYADGARIYRIDLDATSSRDLTPTILNVDGYNATASKPCFYKGKVYVAVGVGVDLQKNNVITYYYNVLEIDPTI